MEKLETQTTLEKLAALLVTPERFGAVALGGSVQLQLPIAENIQLGQE